MSKELEQLQEAFAAQQAALDDAHLVIGQQQVTLLRQARALQELQAQIAQTNGSLEQLQGA